MLRAERVIKSGVGEREAVIDTLTLDRDTRSRRRFRAITDGGCDLLVDLPEALALQHGDRLIVESGAVEVLAAAEPLLEIACADPLALARIAWHLGNRHTAAEITADAIYIQPDYVLRDMAAGLGADVREVMRLFQPEGGAYGGHSGPHGHHNHRHHMHDHSDHEVPTPAHHAHSHAHPHSPHDHSAANRPVPASKDGGTAAPSHVMATSDPPGTPVKSL